MTHEPHGRLGNEQPSEQGKYDAVSTTLQHAGAEHRVGSGIIGATETSVTFRTGATSDYPVYARLGNLPAHAELEALAARLHGSPAAIAFGSGMAAVSAAVFTLLSPGDELLVQENCYGGVQQLLTRVLTPWGVTVKFARIEDWPDAITKRTKLCHFESISNPFCTPQRIDRAVAAARRVGARVMCDNTFASPIFCRPIAHGVDLVIESATKYMNGHSDVVAGCLATSTELATRIREVAKLLGGFLPASSCAQLLRGLRTLEIRMRAHEDGGKRFAEAMRNARSVVAEVWHGSPDPAIARFFPDGFGGMVAVRFAPQVNVEAMLRRLKLVADVPSLGGTESSATMPWHTTNRNQSESEKAAIGIDRQLVRFSIGLEKPEDIANDVLTAAQKA